MPRFAVPDAPDYDETAIVVEQTKVEREFDEYLANLLTQRALRYRLREPAELRRVQAVVLPLVREEVDPALIACICSNDPVKNHYLPIPKNPLYKREDHVKSRVRALVSMVYPGAHREFIRQKTHGCMMTIQYKVGSIRIVI